MNFKRCVIGDIVDNLQTGKTPPTTREDYFNGDINWYTPGDLTNGKLLNKSIRRISKVAVDEKKAIVFEPNTVLISCIGDIGKLGITQELSSSNQQICGIMPKNVLIAEYLYYWFMYNKKYISDIANKAVVPIINSTRLKELKFYYPTQKSDQEIICKILDKADTIRKKRKETIKLADEFLRSTFLEMFGDPITNPKKWPQVDFEEVLFLQRGFDLPTYERDQDGDIDVYGSNGVLSSHNIAKVKGGGVITGRSGTIGKVHYTLNDYWPLNTTLFSKNLLGNNIIYLAYMLKMFNLERFDNGTGVPTLNRNIVHKEKIYKVDVNLQNKFAEIVEKTEKLKEKYQQSLEESENLFNSLMQRAFKGEL